MTEKILNVVCNLLLSCCNISYLKKLFWKPKQDESVFLKDRAGRIVVYRGVNVSNFSKYSPQFLPWQTKEDFARLNDWGFNLVRYLVFWDAIEPVKGSYNDQYINDTIERIQWLQDLGIDVIIDFHQDLFCSKYTGTGFPEWAADDEGIPFVEQHPWNLNYFEPAVVKAFNNFWKNKNLQTDYINMLRYFMSKVDVFDNVVGFDVINEPFPGTLPNFERDALSEFYAHIQVMMTINNFRSNLCFEPEIYTSGGIPSAVNFYPHRNCMYSPHCYDPFCHEGATYSKINKWLLKINLDVKQREAQVYRVPLLIGEFGINSSVKGYLDYLNDFVEISNKNLINWTYYTYDTTNRSSFGILNPDGSETDKLQALVALYPQKIAGSSPVVEHGKNCFTLQYDTNGTEKESGVTEIFIPHKKSVEINGASVVTDRCLIYKYKNQNNPKQCIKITWSD